MEVLLLNLHSVKQDQIQVINKIKNIESGIVTSSTDGANENNIEKVLSGNLADISNGQSANNDISNNAVNVKDLSDVAKAIIDLKHLKAMN